MGKSPKPKTASTIALFIVGIGLIITAAVIILKGIGILGSIPPFVIWALVLFTVGAGILAAINNLSDR